MARRPRTLTKPTVQTLAKRGMVAWEVDGVLSRLTKKQSADVDLRAAMGPFVRAVGAFAAYTKARALGGRWAGGPIKPYKDGWTRRISTEYMRAAGLGKTWYRGRATMNAQSRGGGRPFFVSGGMWDGLQARGVGRYSVTVDFGGSSEGAGKKTVEGNRAWYAGERVRNQQKIAAIVSKRLENPIQPSMDDSLAVASVCQSAAQVSIAKAWGGAVVWNANALGSPELAEKMETIWWR